MDRRQAIKRTFGVAAATVGMGDRLLGWQGTAPGAVGGTSTFHVNPAGADTHSGEQGAPLRTLAEAARRLNASSGSRPATILLSEGVHDPSFLKLSATKVTEQPVVFEHDASKRTYLHPAAGSDAAAVGAGLFTKALA